MMASDVNPSVNFKSVPPCADHDPSAFLSSLQIIAPAHKRFLDAVPKLLIVELRIAIVSCACTGER